MTLIAFSCRHRGTFACLAVLLIALIAAVPLAMAAKSSVAAATAPTYGNDPAHGATASIHGTTIYHEIHGQGGPLLLLHGNGQSIAALDKQIAVFSEQNAPLFDQTVETFLTAPFARPDTRDMFR